MNYFILFFTFAKFSLLSFGGGYVVIPLLYETFVNDLKILSHIEFGNLISISQVLPGPTSINTSTYIGYTQNGIFGSIVSALGFIIPSLILTSIAVSILKKYEDSWFIQGFLKGARLCAFVMILYSIPLFFNMSVISNAVSIKDIFSMFAKKTFILPDNFSFNILEFFIFILCFVLIKKGISATKAIILSAVIGCGVSLFKYYIL